MTKACDNLAETVPEADTDAIDARVAAIRDVLSLMAPGDNSILSVGDPLERDSCLKAFKILADQMVNEQTWEKAVALAALGNSFSKKVELNVTDSEELGLIEQAQAKFTVVEKVAVLTDANASYLSLGELAQTRFENEVSMEKIKAVVAALDPISTCTVVFEDGLVKSTCDEQRNEAEAYRKEYGELYCGCYRPVLITEHTKLAATAAGGPDGAKWREHVPAACTPKELVANVGDTLSRVDINGLVVQCANAAKAMFVFVC